MPELLHNLLTENSFKYPDKDAVSYRGSKLSYRDLNELSDKLSSLCNARGVVAGERIGIYIDKSTEAIVAIFGILKSGACYVPLDPLAPVDRHVLIVNDCSMKYLIASSKKLPQIRKMLPNLTSLEYIFILDASKEECREHEDIDGVTLLFKDELHNEEIGESNQHGTLTNESDLAYILYTSGSTGQPKGVMLSHRAAMSFVDWSVKALDVRSSDIVSSHAPFHFDLSVFDVFVTIKAGATICLVPQGVSSFPRSVVDFIVNEKITIWYSVPSILIQLVLHGKLEESNLSSLRHILFAGEVFPSKYLRKLMELLPRMNYFNLYGPTETNVITCFHVKKPPSSEKTIPIGELCDGVTSYILDESGLPVKHGEIGELYVTSSTLMKGYWNDSQKTNTVLYQNPFNTSSEELIYKTGDLVSLNDNGTLNYHGRCDTMIKSRGYRIELGEVETALSSHPGLREAAVTAIPDEKIGSIIKAVVVAKNPGDISENEVKRYCSKKLPHYMLPEIISIVDSLPRTSTGKIDRKKLMQHE